MPDGLEVRDVLDATAQWVVVYDQDLRILHANTAALEALQRPLEQLVGRTWQEIGLPAQVMGELMSLAAKTLEDGARRSCELQLGTGDGRRWFACHLARLVDASGAKTIVSSKIEVTDLRRVTEELERYASVIAHDFRSPLAGIAMQSELLLERHDDDALKMIHDVATHLLGLAETLLGKARAGSLQPAMQDTPVEQTIQPALTALAAQLEQAGAHVDVDAAHVAHVDGELMGQVWQNLMENTLRYTPQPRITIRSHAHDGGVRVVYSDNGPGIPEDKIPDVFQPYARLGRTDGSGVGLGLSLCRRIVEACGGRIRCVPSNGARFELDLPA